MAALGGRRAAGGEGARPGRRHPPHQRRRAPASSSPSGSSGSRTLVGRESVMGGTDCGFAQGAFIQRVHPTIQWAKLEALAEGARLATERALRYDRREAIPTRSREPRREKIAATMASARARCAWLLIDTATVPASGPAGLLVGVVVRRLSAGPDPEPGRGGVRRADVGLGARAAQPLPDLRGPEHDDAHARARSPPATRSACTSRSSSAGRSMRRRRGGRASPGSGDVISYETSHPVVFRADQPYESLVVRVPKTCSGGRRRRSAS